MCTARADAATPATAGLLVIVGIVNRAGRAYDTDTTRTHAFTAWPWLTFNMKFYWRDLISSCNCNTPQAEDGEAGMGKDSNYSPSLLT